MKKPTKTTKALEDEKLLEVPRKNVRMACALRDTTPAAASIKAGLSRNAISQFIGGTTTLSYANMMRVCNALNVPIGLMHREDAITEGTIRLHRALETLPDHVAETALRAAVEARR